MAGLVAGPRLVARLIALAAAAFVCTATPAAADGAGAASRADVSPFRAAVEARASFDAAPAAAASAQRVVRRQPARARRGIGIHGFVLYERTAMIASQSFDAVLGSSTLSGTGGGVEVLRLWRGLFARVVGSTARAEGSRTIAAGGDPESVDIPTTVEVSPLVIGAGWRVPVGRTGRVVPYGGAGFLRLSYRETSKFATDAENTIAVFHGYTVFGGVDVGIWKVLSAGVEAEVRHAPRAIGTAGVSQVFDEHDLGGSAIRVLVGVRY
jgi:hypothetical protein